MNKKLTKQINGKDESKPVPVTLDQVWGDKGLGKYKTMDASEYEKQLKEMNKSDLQSHAIKMGIMPNDNREKMTKELIKIFLAHVATFRRPANPVVGNKNVSEQALKILSEGR